MAEVATQGALVLRVLVFCTLNSDDLVEAVLSQDYLTEESALIRNLILRYF